METRSRGSAAARRPGRHAPPGTRSQQRGGLDRPFNPDEEQQILAYAETHRRGRNVSWLGSAQELFRDRGDVADADVRNRHRHLRETARLRAAAEQRRLEAVQRRLEAVESRAARELRCLNAHSRFAELAAPARMAQTHVCSMCERALFADEMHCSDMPAFDELADRERGDVPSTFLARELVSYLDADPVAARPVRSVDEPSALSDAEPDDLDGLVDHEADEVPGAEGAEEAASTGVVWCCQCGMWECDGCDGDVRPQLQREEARAARLAAPTLPNLLRAIGSASARFQHLVQVGYMAVSSGLRRVTDDEGRALDDAHAALERAAAARAQAVATQGGTSEDPAEARRRAKKERAEDKKQARDACQAAARRDVLNLLRVRRFEVDRVTGEHLRDEHGRRVRASRRRLDPAAPSRTRSLEPGHEATHGHCLSPPTTHFCGLRLSFAHAFVERPMRIRLRLDGLRRYVAKPQLGPIIAPTPAETPGPAPEARAGEPTAHEGIGGVPPTGVEQISFYQDRVRLKICRSCRRALKPRAGLAQLPKEALANDNDAALVWLSVPVRLVMSGLVVDARRGNVVDTRLVDVGSSGRVLLENTFEARRRGSSSSAREGNRPAGVRARAPPRRDRRGPRAQGARPRSSARARAPARAFADHGAAALAHLLPALHRPAPP